MQDILHIVQRHFLENDPVPTYVIPTLKIVAIVIVSYIILRYSGGWVDRLFQLRTVDENRAATMAKLLKSMIRYAVYFIGTLTILINIGLDPTPVLAGAGIIGLAIGFGAQNLVKDVITGFFLIFENQLHVGDYVEINGKITGTVEEIGLRVTKIREWNQRLHYLSNGEISQIANYNRDQMRPLVDVVVPYEEDQENALELLENICQKLSKQHKPHLIEAFSVYGITNIDDRGVHYTLMAVSVPDQYWFLERELRKTIVRDFKAHRIEIAYPRRVLFGPDAENSPPLIVATRHGKSDGTDKDAL